MPIDKLKAPAKLHFRVIPVTRARQNCSLAWCGDTGRAVVIDPGGDIERMLLAIREEGVQVERLLITHGHPDHAGAAFDLADLLQIPIEGPHWDDMPLLARLGEVGELYGFEDCLPFRPDRWLQHGDAIAVGRQTLNVLHCPGHTPGHLAYVSQDARLAFVGDILFHGAVGATKTPQDHLQLLYSIREKLFPLGDDIVFVPGHEALSTFGEERVSNPVVSDRAAQKYHHLFAVHHSLLR